MSNTARKTRKRNRRDQGYSTVTRFELPHLIGTPFAARLANQPRPIFGIATSPNPTRHGITSRVAAGYRARGLALPISTRVR